MTQTPKAHGSQDADQLALVHDTDTPASALPAPTTQEPSTLSENDYETIAAAVMETERGRWFLQEYARRNRNSDTQTVLTALERLEDKIGEAKPVTASQDASVALLSHNVIDLAEAITQVKREVQELGGKDSELDHFNTATEELEAIVTQTETATGEILEAAEKVQEVLWVLREEGASETQCDIIESKIIDIYTACSFQDLTGQRSSKVVRLVSYVEKRVASMMSILGLSSSPHTAAEATAEEASADDTRLAYQEDDERTDAHLLHGPSSESEANQQDDVDALFGDFAQSADTLEDEALQAERDAAELMEDLAQTADTNDADIFTNDAVIEIHDAEIFMHPDEEAVASSSVSADAAGAGVPDVFEVDQLAFDGPDMADQLARARQAHMASGQLDQSDVLADLPDNFAIDESDGDIFMDAPATPIEAPLADAVEEAPTQSGDMPDIFDVDMVDEGHSTEAAEAAEESDLDDALSAMAQSSVHHDEEHSEAETASEAEEAGEAVLDEPETSVEEPAEAEPVPYTDEERIALFS